MSKVVTLKDDAGNTIYPRTSMEAIVDVDNYSQIKAKVDKANELEQDMLNATMRKGITTATVRIDTTNPDPEAALTYIDDATGHSTGWNAWKNEPIFKDIKPCVYCYVDGVDIQYLDRDDMSKTADGGEVEYTVAEHNYDYYTEIPKMGYRLWKEGNYQYVSVTTEQNKANYCYYAHSLNTVGDCDKLYVGSFLASEGLNATVPILKSIPNEAPSNNKSLTEYRELIANNNEMLSDNLSVSLFSFYTLTLLQCLYVIMYKNLDSQSALGMGYIEADSAINTGGTLFNTFCYGTNSGTQQVKFLGIEDFYGNEYYWVDGLYCDSSMNIKTDYMFTNSDGANFQFSTPSGLTNNTYSYTSDIQGINEAGFIIKANNGNTNTYYCDYGRLYAGYYGCFGGSWADGSRAGAFLLNVYCSASSLSSDLGSRIQLKHLA